MKVYNAGESDAAIGQIGSAAFDFRTVRFASQGTVVLGHVYTETNVGIGSVTAISKVGNQGPSTCRIAGPDNILEGASVGIAAVTTSQVDQFQECTITLTLDQKGCPIDIHAQSNVAGVTCQVEEVTQIEGRAIRGGQCKGATSPFTTDGSTCVWYCPTSTGSCFKVCK
jgi:hypothetical protein